jgi:hypothetical protein
MRVMFSNLAIRLGPTLQVEMNIWYDLTIE